MSQQLENIERLFRDYQALEDSFFDQRISELKSRVQKLGQKLPEQVIKWRELKSIESPDYNLFEILNIRHYEAKVHTPFLANLLDPEGSHDQGWLFIESFMHEVIGWKYARQDISHFYINQEESTDHGRFDIIIQFRYLGTRKAVLIENKIYAKDQEKQLERYYDYLIEGLKLKQDHIRLLYLTMSAQLPTEQSINRYLADSLIKKGILMTLGYRPNIQSWLQDCLLNTKSLSVKHTIKQYLKSIESL